MLTELGPHVAENNQQIPRETMHPSGLRILAAAFGTAMLFTMSHPALAQSADPKSDKQQGGEAKDGQKKLDEYVEAEKLLGGPAANPECLWLGRRVVSLLARDDLDTAFRHLDLYDRFSCPAGHIQAAFRCVVRQGEIDHKAAEKINDRVRACWLNPNLEMKGTAAAPSGTTNR